MVHVRNAHPWPSCVEVQILSWPQSAGEHTDGHFPELHSALGYRPAESGRENL